METNISLQFEWNAKAYGLAEIIQKKYRDANRINVLTQCAGMALPMIGALYNLYNGIPSTDTLTKGTILLGAVLFAIVSYQQNRNLKNEFYDSVIANKGKTAIDAFRPFMKELREVKKIGLSDLDPIKNPGRVLGSSAVFIFSPILGVAVFTGLKGLEEALRCNKLFGHALDAQEEIVKMSRDLT